MGCKLCTFLDSRCLDTFSHYHCNCNSKGVFFDNSKKLRFSLRMSPVGSRLLNHPPVECRSKGWLVVFVKQDRLLLPLFILLYRYNIFSLIRVNLNSWSMSKTSCLLAVFLDDRANLNSSWDCKSSSSWSELIQLTVSSVQFYMHGNTLPHGEQPIWKNCSMSWQLWHFEVILSAQNTRSFLSILVTNME